MSRTTRNSQRTAEVPDHPLEPMEPDSTTINEMIDDGVVDRPPLKEDADPSDDNINEGRPPPSEPTQVEQDMSSPRQVLMTSDVRVTPGLESRSARLRAATESRSRRSLSRGSNLSDSLNRSPSTRSTSSSQQNEIIALLQ
eukprot:161171-Hanusia_phi.AAC.1